jgi:hypothetical protein
VGGHPAGRADLPGAGHRGRRLIECARPVELARFWALALGYVEREPPGEFGTWEDWFAHYEIPEDERDDGAALSDPDGVLPSLTFLKVPEPKTAKPRMHLDLQVGGGRDNVPSEQRRPRVLAAAEQLTAAGATLLVTSEELGKPDHLIMADPEGNEFCLV